MKRIILLVIVSVSLSGCNFKNNNSNQVEIYPTVFHSSGSAGGW